MIDPRILICAAVSVLGHFALGEALSTLPPRPPPVYDHKIEIRVVPPPPEEPPPEPPKPPEPKPEPKGPPIAAREVDGAVVLVFPAERFDLDIAAALGKRDWDQVVRRSDNLPGEVRDKIQRDGAGWIAPIEFLSEVFVDGKPLTKAEFERASRSEHGVRSLDVHFPRFGAVTLLEISGKGRFVTSLDDAARAAKLVM